MASDFPTSVPSYASSNSSMTLEQFLHLARHQQMESDIVAVASKLGTGASTASSGTVLRGTGSGTSAFGKLTLSSDVNSFTSSDLRTLLSDETGSGAAVFATSPTIVTPTIASFANANHNHSNSAGGGALSSAAVSSAIAPASITFSQIANNASIQPKSGGVLTSGALTLQVVSLTINAASGTSTAGSVSWPTAFTTLLTSWAQIQGAGSTNNTFVNSMDGSNTTTARTVLWNPSGGANSCAVHIYGLGIL